MSDLSISAGCAEEPCLQPYLQRIKRYEVLTKEEEFILAQRIRRGDMDALHNLVNANLCHVVRIAGKFLDHGLDGMDLIAEGTVGLITAARDFDGRDGISFISFAKGRIFRAIRKALAANREAEHCQSQVHVHTRDKAS